MSSRSESEKYDICFVSNKEKEGDDGNLQKAFSAMVTVELDPVWVTKKSCLMIDKKEPKLFVMDPFEGSVYDHLKSLDCRIVGPICILSCLERNETLPKRPHPVFSVAMRGITVTCSNLNKALRETFCTKIQLMGGNFSKDLTKSVTHLVVGEVGSKKYHVAANFGLIIMLPTWIEELWNNGQYNQIHGTDAVCNKFKCPVFKGLSITVSQISNDERAALKAAIEDNGGRYSGSLKSRETTHLVLLEPHGEKYNFAKSWRLHCVKVDWLYDSVRLGYCMDEDLYPLDVSSAPKRSTPIKENENVKLSVDCSAINASTTINQLDETSQNEISVIFKSKQNSPLNEIDEFDISALPKFGQFLDGCKIYLCGFKGKHLDKLRKIINFSGGMRFSKYSDSISHVVCYEKNEYLMDCIENSSAKPHIVTFRWLLECSKFQKIVDESLFILPELTPPPTSDQPDESIPCKDSSKVLNADLSDSKVDTLNKCGTMLLSKDAGGDFTEILRQYSNTEVDIPAETSMAKDDVTLITECNRSLHSITERSSALNGQSVDVDPIDQPVDVDDDVVVNPINQPVPTDQVDNMVDNAKSDDHEISSKLFAGKTFQVLGFGPKEIELLSSMVFFNGGAIAKPSSDTKADIAIVPLVWDNVEVDALVVVTNCWLQKCIEENVILSFDCNELFKPLNIVATQQPLKNLVISISQYTGTERDCLMHLVDVLGGSCQEYFVRKANPSRGLKPNTHLVVCSPEGSKYEASKKWKIPAVTKHWLLAVAKLDVVPPIDNFLVELAQLEAPIQPIEKSSKIILDESTSKTNIEETTIQKSSGSALHGNLKVDETRSKDHDGNKMNEDCDEVFIAPNNRVTELIGTDKKFSPKARTSNRSFESDRQTPKLHISDLLAGFDSSPDDFNDTTNKRNPSLPLQDALTYSINVALQNVGYIGNNSPLGNNAAGVNNTEEVKNKVLENVIVCVSKKMNDLKSELKRIVLSLGGQFRWTYDQTCTHFIFQGKASEFTKDFREAKRHGMKIVSPGWIYACQETQTHVSEEHYPPTVKSRLNLSEQIAMSTSSDNKLEQSQNQENNDCSSPKASQNVTDVETPKRIDNELDFGTVRQTKNVPDMGNDLDKLIVAVKSAKAGKRLCRLRTDSCSTSPIDQSKGNSGASPTYSNIYSSGELKSTVHNIEILSTEPSQSVPITWDDPTGRKEREIIAGVNYNVKDIISNIDAGQELVSSKSTSSLNTENSEAGTFSSVFIDKNNQTVEKSVTAKKFMFTSFSDTEKENLSVIVSELGGLISKSKAFDPSATHLIMGHPLKNLKFLSSVASGKWVLHPSYLNDSADSKCFLPEEAYEWGNEFTESFTKNPTVGMLKVAMCARRWRVKLTDEKILSGAFHDWKVVIIADNTDKCNSYVNILQAGGAKIFSLSSISLKDVQLTHAFVEIGKNSTRHNDLKLLVAHQVKCIKPEYLAYYLIENPPPSEESYMPLEVAELLSSSVRDSAKRSLQSSEKNDYKRSRYSSP